MKRIIPFVAAVLVALSAQAQSVSVHMADGTTQKYGASKVDYIDFGAAGVTPAGVETVDLNLPSGLKWASMNVGATAPEEVGAYFAWGETEPKTDYTWENYALGSNSDAISRSTINKYNHTLNPEDDAATMNWGPKWRMPTKKEFEELLENTTAEFLRLSDESSVVKLTSKVEGFTDKYIILPLPGSISGRLVTPSFDGKSGNYWTSTLDVNLVEESLNQCLNAFEFFINTEPEENDLYDIGIESIRRPHGLSVRPVLARSDGYTEAPLGAEEIDLGLSVKWANMNVGAKAPEEWGNYYAWGETTTNSQYGWYHNIYTSELDEFGGHKCYRGGQNYKWGTYDTGMTGYTGVISLESDDDAATANWGNGWRTPTREDFEELFENTKQKRDVVNGVKGVRFISKSNSSVSIFIPYSGFKQEDDTIDADAVGGCWTSTLHPDNQNRSILYKFSHNDASAAKLASDYRPIGWPVRPVKK